MSLYYIYNVTFEFLFENFIKIDNIKKKYKLKFKKKKKKKKKKNKKKN